MIYIYILELEQEKYYVGKSRDADKRIDNHFENNGSTWTKKYKPIRIIEIIPNSDCYDEDKYTKIYMGKYGINNVRGAAYVKTHLSSSTIKHLELELRSAKDECFICGNFGHFTSSCSTKYKKRSIFIPSKTFTNKIKCKDITKSNKNIKYKENVKCKNVHKLKEINLKDEIKYHKLNFEVDDMEIISGEEICIDFNND